MSPSGTRLTRTWIVYNRPSQPNYTHAGMLMALGLTGNLGCLSVSDLFTYLSQVTRAPSSLSWPSRAASASRSPPCWALSDSHPRPVCLVA